VAPEKNQAINLRVKPGSILFFDAESGARITSNGAVR
jgi:hypothetical protein